MASRKIAIAVPYKKDIPCGLRVGSAVRVKLYVNEDACGFQIKFNGDACERTIPLQFNCSLGDETVTLNTKDGCWQVPERGPGCFQFHRGHIFDIVFIASGGCFDIFVNGSFYTSYKYRIAVERIRCLKINGNIIPMDVEVNEPLPKDFTKLLPSCLTPGDAIAVKGFFYQGGNGFAINLVRGNCSNDIALHFNPRRSENSIVLDSQNNGCWVQNLERHPLPCQWQQKVFFEVEIFYTCKGFKIYISGQWFANFAARSQVADILKVNVQGDAYFYEVQLLRKVDKPFVGTVALPLTVGAWISVTGVVEKCPTRFHVNLQSGANHGAGCDIPFHFNPRFTEGCTVRNSIVCGSWGAPESVQPGFPFKEKERFEIIFLVLCGVYKVFVNGKYYIDYAHRADICRVSHVNLDGDAYFLKPKRC